MKILGSGTKTQKNIVRDTLKLAGADANVIVKIEVYNTNCVEKYHPFSEHNTRDNTTGFSVRPNRKMHVTGNRIVLAGKNPWLQFTTLHELGHLLGLDEIGADDYAQSKL